jgi:hypothetical protein
MYCVLHTYLKIDDKGNNNLHRRLIYFCYFHTFSVVDRDSLVDIATGYGLDGQGIESRWGVRFSAPVQTGSVAHPVPCTMCTVFFPGVKSGRGVTLTPHTLLVLWSRKIRAIPLLDVCAVRTVQSLSSCTFFFHFLLFLHYFDTNF